MPWFKVDDSFASHPKTIALLDDPKGGGRAVGVWTLCGAWSANQLTDGRVSLSVVRRHGGSKAHAEALVRCGLWERIDAEYQYHDWSDWNPTRAEVLAKREARAKAGKAGGFASGRSRREASASGLVRDGSPSVEPPTRPDPTRPIPEDNEEGSSSSLATLLARTWDEASGTVGSHTLHGKAWPPIAANVRAEAKRRGLVADDLAGKVIRHYWRPEGWADRNRVKATPSALGKVIQRAVAEALGESTEGREPEDAEAIAREQKQREADAKMRGEMRREHVKPPASVKDLLQGVVNRNGRVGGG